MMGNFTNSFISTIFNYFPLITKEFLIGAPVSQNTGLVQPPEEQGVIHGLKDLPEKRGKPPPPVCDYTMKRELWHLGGGLMGCVGAHMREGLSGPGASKKALWSEWP